MIITINMTAITTCLVLGLAGWMTVALGVILFSHPEHRTSLIKSKFRAVRVGTLVLILPYLIILDTAEEVWPQVREAFHAVWEGAK